MRTRRLVCLSRKLNSTFLFPKLVILFAAIVALPGPWGRAWTCCRALCCFTSAEEVQLRLLFTCLRARARLAVGFGRKQATSTWCCFFFWGGDLCGLKSHSNTASNQENNAEMRVYSMWLQRNVQVFLILELNLSGRNSDDLKSPKSTSSPGIIVGWQRLSPPML